MKISIKHIAVLYLVLLPSLFIFGQSDPLLRIEIETKSDDATYKIEPCGEQGLILFYETTIKEDNYKFWVFVAYNKFMQETWKKDVPVYKNMSYRKNVLRGKYMYLLFHDADKKKSEVYNYQILKINISNGGYEMFSGEIPDNSRFVDFDVFGDYIIAGMNVDEKQTGIYSLNINSKETKTVLEIENGRSRFASLYIDTLNNSFIGIFNVYISRTEYYFLVKEFDEQNNNINTIKIIPDEGKKFNTGKIITVSENERLLFGTYDIVRSKSIDNKNYFTKESSGFYTAKITENLPAEIKYFNFLELENMTGFLKSREYRSAKKKADKNEKEKDKYSVDFDLLLHDIIQKDSLYYFIAEAFYREYHTVTSTYYDFYGHAVPVSYSVFDGYKYFNAFIFCFDEDGNKLWDNGMEIFNILTFNLKNRVNTYFENNEIIMSYNYDGKISAKIINGPEVIEGVEYFPIESTYVNDKVMTDTKSNMAYWYDNYFIAYGFQIIKNNSLINKSKRTVFYINKVAFQ